MLFMQTMVCVVLLLSCSLSHAPNQDTTPGVATLTPDQLAAANAAIAAAQAKATYGDELRRRVIAGEAVLKREDLAARPAEVASTYLYQDNTTLQGQINNLNTQIQARDTEIKDEESSADKELLDMELGLGIGLGGGMALVGAGGATYAWDRSNKKPTTKNIRKKLREIRKFANSEKMESVEPEQQEKIRTNIEKTREKLARSNLIPRDGYYPEYNPYAPQDHYPRPPQGQPRRRPEGRPQPQYSDHDVRRSGAMEVYSHPWDELQPQSRPDGARRQAPRTGAPRRAPQPSSPRP